MSTPGPRRPLVGRKNAAKTWLLNEALAQIEYGGVRARICHYRSSRRSIVDWVVERSGQRGAYLVTDEEAPGTYLFRTAEAFLKKAPEATVFLIAPVTKLYRERKNITILPYQAMG